MGSSGQEAFGAVVYCWPQTREIALALNDLPIVIVLQPTVPQKSGREFPPNYWTHKIIFMVSYGFMRPTLVIAGYPLVIVGYRIIYLKLDDLLQKELTETLRDALLVNTVLYTPKTLLVFGVRLLIDLEKIKWP